MTKNKIIEAMDRHGYEPSGRERLAGVLAELLGETVAEADGSERVAAPPLMSWTYPTMPLDRTAFRVELPATASGRSTFERFTDRARRVMALANQEAQRLNHESIGAEHILLGLVKECSGVGSNVLKGMNVDLRKLRAEVEKCHPAGSEMVVIGRMPMSPDARAVSEAACEQARRLFHNYVGTEHLLLGLLDGGDESMAIRALVTSGLAIDDIREAVLSLVGYVDAEPVPATATAEPFTLADLDAWTQDRQRTEYAARLGELPREVQHGPSEERRIFVSVGLRHLASDYDADRPATMRAVVGDAFSAHDSTRLRDWCRDLNRKRPELAFTAGAVRQAADAVWDSGGLTRAADPEPAPSSPFAYTDDDLQKLYRPFNPVNPPADGVSVPSVWVQPAPVDPVPPAEGAMSYGQRVAAEVLTIGQQPHILQFVLPVGLEAATRAWTVPVGRRGGGADFDLENLLPLLAALLDEAQADERERWAKVCDDGGRPLNGTHWHQGHQGYSAACANLARPMRSTSENGPAAAIRARGEVQHGH